MYFVGVTTGASSIMRLFPHWAEELGLDAEISGLDLPLDSSPEDYRRTVLTILDDPAARGALVTTHKVGVFRHAGDLFQRADRWAELCREVSCIAKRDSGLEAWAKDPITSWRSFVDFVGADYFARRPEAAVLCLGAGGSGTAFTSRLLGVDHPPARIHVTNRSPERLEDLAEVHQRIGAATPVEYHRVSGTSDTDRLLEGLPPGSVVINATGMGKDRPGSPISDSATFPEGGVAWDFNYRGTLEFLEQARRQRDERGLLVEDGWRYFLHGWSEHIAQVFQLDLDPGILERLGRIAEMAR
jgi:shikimate dehydrogenase